MNAESPLSLLMPVKTGLNTLSTIKLEGDNSGLESEVLSFAEQLENVETILAQEGQLLTLSNNTETAYPLSITIETDILLDQNQEKILSIQNIENLTVEEDQDTEAELLVKPLEISVSPIPLKTETAIKITTNTKSLLASINDLVKPLYPELNPDNQELNELSAITSSSSETDVMQETEEPLANLSLTKNKSQQEGIALAAKDFNVLPEIQNQDNQSSQKINATSSNIVAELNTRLADTSTNIPRNFVVQTQIPVNVAHSQWSQAVGEKVLWLAAQNISAAEIKLDPPELGTLQVKVSLHQDQASVTFVSPHAPVRDAIDQQMQRLRDMFQEQGIHLLNVDVSDKSFSRQRQDAESQNKQAASTFEEDVNPIAVTDLSSRSIRLIDHYA
jgi:flagellar hook-length control protein FliK